jgi:hypothetical protein
MPTHCGASTRRGTRRASLVGLWIAVSLPWPMSGAQAGCVEVFIPSLPQQRASAQDTSREDDKEQNAKVGRNPTQRREEVMPGAEPPKRPEPPIAPC